MADFEHDVIFIDPAAYAALDSWHAAAARLRREDPVHRVEAPGFEPFWAVTRHADVMEVERQHDKFWNTKESVLAMRGQAERLQASGADLKTLIHMDGAEHRAYRAVPNDWFRPANLRRLLETRIEELARKYVDRMLELGGECDFAAEVALYYPLQVIMSILGVPEADEPRMLQLTQKLFGNQDPDFGGDDPEQTVLATLLDFAAYFNAMTTERRAHPTGDLASTIANGRIEGEPLGDLQTISYYVIVATAGHDTTSSSLAGGLETLVRHPDQLRMLRQDPTLVDNAVDEIIRWVTPVRHFMRHAQQDYVLRGTRIAAGDRLLMSYLSANRDESVFEEPFRFDVRRRNADEHLAFGIGVHFCLGAHLARMELRAFFRELLPRLDSIELAGAPEYTSSTFVGGPKRVPIRYRLRPWAA
ncbi:MAG: cytochrome P450 [Candidatus Binatia bacterium]